MGDYHSCKWPVLSRATTYIQEMQTEISCSNQSTINESSFLGVFLSAAETILSSLLCSSSVIFIVLSIFRYYNYYLVILLVRNTKETTSSDNQTLDCINLAFCVVS